MLVPTCERSRRMRPAFVRVLGRLCSDEAGGVAIIFGLMILPMFMLGSFALDYSRGMSVQQQLQGAADAAALAAKGSGADARAAAQAAAEAYAKTNVAKLNGATLRPVSVTDTADGVRVELAADLPTSVSNAFGIASLEIKAASESVSATGDMELALVLDNTGSMNGFMDELKQAAKDLVTAAFDASKTPGKVKVAVVPYVGTVNIGNGPQQMAWMDVNADNSWHGSGIEGISFGYEPGCVYAPGGGGPVDPGAGTHGFLENAARKFASAAGAVLGITPARAASASDVPAPYVFWPDCWAANPFKLNMFDTFASIPNTSWKGCVMARTEWGDRDVSDEAPNPSEPDTLFVPWLWPDTIDASAIVASGDPALETVNDYLPDRLDLRDAQFPKFNDPWIGWAHWNWLKYRNVAATIDEDGPDTLGPNKACPDPLLPLTAVKALVENKIDDLTHWNGSGTNTAEGVAWGMRVLTPGAPFTEGSSDPATKKVMVLMTDGVNNIDPTNDSSILSHWSTFGYLGGGRVQPMSYDGFRQYANARMQKACQFAKEANIDIYTVAFNVTDEATLGLLRDCATKPPYAYSATTATELVEAFRDIGKSLTELRLSK